MLQEYEVTTPSGVTLTVQMSPTTAKARGLKPVRAAAAKPSTRAQTNDQAKRPENKGRVARSSK